MQHGFNVEHAQLYGLDEAIMIRSFEYWINHNRANEWHFHDGCTWSYNSLKAFQEQFPYWTLKQIRRTLTSLVEKGVLIKGRYGADEGWNTFDRTMWYAFANEDQFVPRLAPVASEEPMCPKGHMHVPESDTCIEPNDACAQKGTWTCPKGQMDVPKRANESKEALGTPLGTACAEQQQQSPAHVREPAPAGTPAREPLKTTAAADVLRTPDGDTDTGKETFWKRGAPTAEESKQIAAKVKEWDEEESVRVLLDAGLDSERDAKRYAGYFLDFEIEQFIRQGEALPLRNPAGWLRRQLDTEIANGRPLRP